MADNNVIRIRLDEDCAASLKELARNDKRPLSNYIRLVLEKAIKEDVNK